MENPVDRAVRILNRFLKTDPDACKAFIEQEVPCNDALVDDPDIVVGRSKEGGGNRIRPLGMINGLLGAIKGGPFDKWGPICVVMEADGTYSRFGRTEEVAKRPPNGRQ
jgi:hypothetical protein